jgi:TPR repeat protein
MKRLLLSGILLLTIITPLTTANAGINEGIAAYKIGDYKVAFQEMKVLAINGRKFPQFILGMMFEHGKGVRKNYKEAFRWYHKSALQGYKPAQGILGTMFRDGIGVAKDFKQSIRWFYKAAVQGHVFSQVSLGVMYATGKGVTKDPREAVKWYHRAAVKGDAEAQGKLAMMFFDGSGITQSYKQAAEWFRMAAEQGHEFSQLYLGGMYLEGKGVIKDNVRAYMWANISSSDGNKVAIELRNLTEKNMPPALIVEAQRLSRETEKKIRRNILARERTQISENPTKLPSKLVEQAAKIVTSKIQFPKGPVRPDDIAVIIGNSNYKKLGKDIPNVIPAYSDAENMKHYFTQALGVREGNIIHLRDATKAQLTSILGSNEDHRGKLFNWTKPNVSKIYVYYVGHGAPAGDRRTAYLVPSDADSDTVQLTGYPLKQLYRNLGNIPAISITVILEACFSGQSQNGYLSRRTSGLSISPRMPTIPTKITVISAGAANQVASWEKDESQSLFTKYFLRGLSGEGDRQPYGDGNGKVALDELKKYLDGTMTYYARRYYGRDQKAQITVNGREISVVN